MISSLKSKFDILPKQLIFIGSEKMVVYQWYKGEITNSYIFDCLDNGRAQFERYLSEVAVMTTYVLVDVAEEEFRIDTVPHVYGRDRTAVLDRKKERLFRGSDYVYDEIHNRESEGRRDDNILLSSIGKSDLLRPWLELLEKYKFPVVAVTSVALFSHKILEYLPNRKEKTLLITMQSMSGLRQSFFDGENLKISRVVKMPRFGTTPYAPIIVSEIEKIQRYLNSLRLVSIDEQLNVYFLTEGELLQELKSKLEDTESITYKLIDLNYMAKQEKLNFSLKTPFSDKLFAYHLLKKGTKNAYAKANEVRYSTMRRIRYATYGLSLLLIVGSLGLSGWFLMNAIHYKQNSLSAIKKTEHYQERFNIAREGLPKTPIEPNDIKTVVNIADKLEKYKTSPESILRVIGSSLKRFPRVILENVKWDHSLDPNDQFKLTQVANPYGLATINTGVQNQSGNLYYQIATFDARIANFNGDFRSAIKIVNELAETIRSKDHIESVTVEEFPVDISSEASLQGSVEELEKEAKFKIRIALGVPDESEK